MIFRISIQQPMPKMMNYRECNQSYHIDGDPCECWRYEPNHFMNARSHQNMASRSILFTNFAWVTYALTVLIELLHLLFCFAGVTNTNTKQVKEIKQNELHHNGCADGSIYRYESILHFTISSFILFQEKTLTMNSRRLYNDNKDEWIYE